uniref:Uncharacterized protein n=1 Tax=Caenorhabditis japonica TaxID=281687 RepID=A0A8R1IIS7_CAEJA
MATDQVIDKDSPGSTTSSPKLKRSRMARACAKKPAPMSWSNKCSGLENLVKELKDIIAKQEERLASNELRISTLEAHLSTSSSTPAPVNFPPLPTVANNLWTKQKCPLFSEIVKANPLVSMVSNTLNLASSLNAIQKKSFLALIENKPDLTPVGVDQS